MLVCVCQSDPPGHKASTSRPVAFQPEASFSFTAGGKQTNTRENSNKTVETWWTTEKTKKTYTLPVFVWGVEKHSQRGLLDYYCCKNKEQNTENNMCKIRLMTFLSLKKAFCWCYDFVLPMCWSMICWLYSKTEFLSVVICNNQLVVEQLQGRVVQWDSYFSPLRDGL